MPKAIARSKATPRSKATQRAVVGVIALGTIVASAPVALGQQADATASSRASASSGDALKAVGLSPDGRRLVSFGTDRPESARHIGAVRGLSNDTHLVGIDYRPANGKLYGLGNKGGVYTVSRYASATKVSQLSVALVGMHFGVDFNPAVDRLRVISDTGQNLRHNVDLPTGGTLVDATLSYPATDTTPATTAVGVTAAAYTNNDSDPNTGATLYDVDTQLDQLVIQSPANAGLLAATGKLGAAAGSNAGFDIYSEVRNGTAVELHAFATLKVGSSYRLYKITLFNGRANAGGAFPTNVQVSDLAFAPNQL